MLFVLASMYSCILFRFMGMVFILPNLDIFLKVLWLLKNICPFFAQKCGIAWPFQCVENAWTNLIQLNYYIPRCNSEVVRSHYRVISKLIKQLHTYYVLTFCICIPDRYSPSYSFNCFKKSSYCMITTIYLQGDPYSIGEFQRHF